MTSNRNPLRQLRRILSLLLLTPLFGPPLPALLASGLAQARTESVEQLYAQAHTAQAAGHTEEAVALYRRIIAQSPRLAAAYNNLGLLLVNSRQYSEAVPPLLQALKLQPNSAPTQALLGGSYVMLNPSRRSAASA